MRRHVQNKWKSNLKKMENEAGVLAVMDLGNTSITYGVFRGEKLLRWGGIGNTETQALLRQIRSGSRMTRGVQVMLCSVVPQIEGKLLGLLSREFGKDHVFLAGKDIQIPISSRYKKRQAGMDRLVNAYGGVKMYGPPCLVIDFGTAVTFDYVSRGGVFEGGLIVPGLSLSLRALSAGTALLPELRQAKRVKTFLGRDTRSAMLSGVTHGLALLAEGFIGEFKKRFGKNIKVIAAGGDAQLIGPLIPSLDRIDPAHTIKSLRILYEEEARNKKRVLK